MKIFGLCCVNHDKQVIKGVVLPFTYHNFDEPGLRMWMRKWRIEIDDHYITDAKPGDTHSFMVNHHFVFWRIK
ncbi:MAG: hypothetical protein A2406_03265 [Candidatus Komeilibacteria bacterium RIFOXYC1_FULL_37_11]|uniref:Uncharacterized protein n=1 Tax=Candidatus Komeilibacteria bacterium RIFOXYC1_FULL_37_11 TaxID=1798555 RepID=A0A1G2C2M6_9BACT|nr:MAG: hypothetical protein A2406_03265 [Candidatus Komeilibacteria bacterium RIFOXYC1_FULL_37_11]OGY95959.1 MAG: hypothetical protein A2611_04025 [Candidatus Komeilibacteria bacterium RIFOXYD1_FULL_37_29]